MRAHDVEAVGSEMITLLRGHGDLDWDAPAGSMDWSCRDTALHVADDPGFAAMGVLETVVHTHDIATGLGLSWTPPADTCRSVLVRLFPDAPQDPPDAVAALLWATGRGTLPDRAARGAGWRWDSSVRN